MVVFLFTNLNNVVIEGQLFIVYAIIYTAQIS